MKSLASIAAIAVSIGMYYMYISTAAVEVKTLSVKKSELSSVLEKANSSKQKRDELSSAYESISAGDLQKLGKIVPEKFDQILFINDMSSLARKNNLTFGDFNTSNSSGNTTQVGSENTPYKTTSVSFRVTGQYDDFLKFLKSVEMSLRLVDVVKLTVVPSGQDKNNSMAYSLDINIYSLK